MKKLIVAIIFIVATAGHSFGSDFPTQEAAGEAVRVVLEGSFKKMRDKRVLFIDDTEMKYTVINKLHEKALAHVDKQVKIVAKVKDSKLIVYLGKIEDAGK